MRKVRIISLFSLVFFITGLSCVMVYQLNGYVQKNYPMFHPAGLTPSNYSKKAYTKQKVYTADGSYHYAYTFKNIENTIITWSWKFDKTATDRMINQYGLPGNYYESYYATDEMVLSPRFLIVKSIALSPLNGYAILIDFIFPYNTFYTISYGKSI